MQHPLEQPPRRPDGFVGESGDDGSGLTRFERRELARQGRLVRLHRGLYLPREVWDAAPEQERYRWRAAAQVTSLKAEVAVSHGSAAVLLGLPLWGQQPTRLHLSLTGPGRGWRREGYTVHRSYGEGSVVPDSAPPVVLPVLAALGLAETDGFLAGVTALDAALHRGLTTIQEARQWLGRLRRRPGMRMMTRVVEAADGLSESPLETKARLCVRLLGYRVSLQVVLRTVDGEFVARVDLLIEELGVVIEVDGQTKYRTDAGGGSVQTLLSEKQRESAIRDLGYGVVRVDNRGLESLADLDRRIRDAADRAAPWVKRPRPPAA